MERLGRFWEALEDVYEIYRKRTNRVVFQHAQWPVCSWPDERLIVACHGHGYEADGDGAGFGYLFGFNQLGGSPPFLLFRFFPLMRNCFS